MRACLADAGQEVEEVDCFNAHGSGTKTNETGTVAIKRRLRDAICEGVVPPTANYREPDPDCDLDTTPKVASESESE